jgi:23S rRNA pseudouridine1911/1915/1917 synthase
VAAADAGLRLDAWLARQPEAGSRSKALAWIERGKVFHNDKPVAFKDAGRRLVEDDRVALWVDRPGTSRAPRRTSGKGVPVRVIFEDASVLVVDKPAGVLAVPLPSWTGDEPTLFDAVSAYLGPSPRSRPRVVHRIDRDTSGLVLFAKTSAAQEGLQAQFERHTAERVYQAVVHGIVSPPAGTWRDRLVWDKDRLRQRKAHPAEERARDAIARYRVVEQFAGAASIEVSLVTGKRNQIRIQAALRGHPIVGEKVYVPAKAGTYRGRAGTNRGGSGTLVSGRARAAHSPAPAARTSALVFPRQALHAHRLAFDHPATGQRVRIESALPEDMSGLIARLRIRS